MTPPVIQPKATTGDIERLLEFATKHTADEAAAAFPMFSSDVIGHLYALTERQRFSLFAYLFTRVPERRRTTATPIHSQSESTDSSGPSASWDIIVRLYEDS